MEKRDEVKTPDKFIVWEALKSIIYNNIDFYKSDDTTNGIKLHGAFLGILDNLDEARPLIEEVESFCKLYDFDEKTPGNGHRSFLKVFDCAINHTLKIVKYVTESRSSLLFRKSTYTKEVEACNHMLAALITFLNHLLTLHSWSEVGNLFPVEERPPEDILDRAKTVNQFAFYGRCLGFQFCDSIKPVLKFIAISMASYSESYYSNNGTFIKATNSMFNSGKYLLDPELRSKRIVNLSQNASVDFCKSFWFLADNEIMNKITLVNYNVKVNKLMKVTTEALKVETTSGDEIEIPSVGQIQIRLVSSHFRDGMMSDNKNESKKRKSEGILPKSKALIVHIHGGGFVSQSSKSHLVYLSEWADQLNVPILSLDYSLAPQSPYPKALNEVFYGYCWALKNRELLGSTCETVILAGDSAGANLALATSLKCIDLKVRKPDGIFIAYCPILVAFNPSPSRLLCLMDPLLPFGFMMRCMKAYSNPSSKECFKDLEELKRAKADRNEELKRKSSINPEQDQEMMQSEDEKSDSFEEISCFERHQTDSNLQAHISPVSDVASNHTLAGASFLTGTDNKMNDTIEIISPIDSIRSATSLEEDSLPITIQKNEKRSSVAGDVSGEFTNVDLPATTSSRHSDDTTCHQKKYVDDFIEKYVLDAKQCDDGSIQPVLRKASHTKSEENIVFDISRDTISVQSLQEKVQRVASSLVDSVSSTFTQITTTNRPIIRNYSLDDSDDVRSLENESVPTSPSSDFIFNVPKDPFLSPLFASDEALRQFPPIKIVTLTLDPCLDDSVMFAKKLRELKVELTLDILDGLPHGFLNFSRLSKEAHDGSKLAMSRIAELLNVTVDADETKVKYFC
ncbi:CLUMA_CG018701, isoform A [Clunio marinus]|uniref:Hormone-sensitive lipase n=1 Tax=Clunio marinus TaxID=568069 RepID=A0A1J1J1N4_9DIPT|nr:CLUMA_CG018701, isoform A [Clunio marinus]